MSNRVTNPFESAEEQYLILVNEENQHSLWPAFADVPAGWTTAHGPDSRRACLTFVEQNWTDITPQSLLRREAD